MDDLPQIMTSLRGNFGTKSTLAHMELIQFLLASEWETPVISNKITLAGVVLMPLRGS